MGIVYSGEDLSSGKQVAVKIMRGEMSSNEAMIARFNQEIQISKKFAHPFVIKILDGGIVPSKDLLYMVMEFLEGESLAERCVRQKLDSKTGMEIMLHLGEALSYIHQRSVFHRDIKPDNILLVSKTRTVLLDFGLALQDGKTRLSKTSERPGTFITMSPEQLSGQTIDGRSDVYSLGTTMYWAVTGKAPFTADQQIRIAVGTLDTKPTPPHLLNKDISRNFSEAIMKSIEISLEERFQSADDLCKALKGGVIPKSAHSIKPHVNRSKNHNHPEKDHITPEKVPGRTDKAHNNPGKLNNKVHAEDGSKKSHLRIKAAIFLTALLSLFSAVLIFRSLLPPEREYVTNRVPTLNSCKAEFLQSGEIPSQEVCILLGNEVEANNHKYPGSLLRGKVPEISGLYFLFQSARHHELWTHAFNCVIFSIGKHGYGTLTNEPYGEFKLLDEIVWEGKLFDEFIDVCRKKMQTSDVDSKIKGDSILGLATALRISVNDTRFSNLKERTPRLLEALSLYRLYKTKYLNTDSVGAFANLYSRTLGAFSSARYCDEGIEFVNGWVRRDLSNYNKFELYYSAGYLLSVKSEEHSTEILEARMKTALQYVKKALPFAREADLNNLHVLEMSYARLMVDAGLHNEACKLAEDLTRQNPDYLLDGKYVEVYTSLLANAGQIIKAKKILGVFLEYNRKYKVITKKKTVQLGNRISEYSRFEQFMNIQKIRGQ